MDGMLLSDPSGSPCVLAVKKTWFILQVPIPCPPSSLKASSSFLATSVSSSLLTDTKNKTEHAFQDKNDSGSTVEAAFVRYLPLLTLEFENITANDSTLIAGESSVDQGEQDTVTNFSRKIEHASDLSYPVPHAMIERYHRHFLQPQYSTFLMPSSMERTSISYFKADTISTDIPNTILREYQHPGEPIGGQPEKKTFLTFTSSSSLHQSSQSTRSIPRSINVVSIALPTLSEWESLDQQKKFLHGRDARHISNQTIAFYYTSIDANKYSGDSTPIELKNIFEPEMSLIRTRNDKQHPMSHFAMLSLIFLWMLCRCSRSTTSKATYTEEPPRMKAVRGKLSISTEHETLSQKPQLSPSYLVFTQEESTLVEETLTLLAMEESEMKLALSKFDSQEKTENAYLSTENSVTEER